MSHPLTQHRITPLSLPQLRKSGNHTVHDSIEFDLHARKENNQLVFGHPGDIAQGKERPRALQPLMDFLKTVPTQQLVLDVKARAFTPEKGPHFGDGELNIILRDLLPLLDDYLDGVENQTDSPELVIASVFPELFTAITEAGIELPEECETRFFARDTDENPFETAKELGVTQIGLAYPDRDSQNEMRLEELARLAAQPEYSQLAISFYIPEKRGEDNETKMERERHSTELIRKHFPNAEVITNFSTTIEQDETKRELTHKRPR